MEIGNNVFAYQKTINGLSLFKRNVDFGGGLERMMASVHDNPDIFLIDLFDLSRTVIERLSGKKYGSMWMKLLLSSCS